MITSSDHRGDSTAAADPDSKLGALIDELADRLQAGQAVDLEACVREYPEHESQLRSLFPALEMMAALGRSADQNNHAPPPGNDPRLGSGVLGDYRIVREVGRGGMGVVFEAMQVSLGRRVALKILPLAAAVDPRHLQRFQLEAQAAAHLHHPHIVPIHAVGCDRGVHYYAMQFIQGRSMADLVRQERREGTGDKAEAARTSREPSPGRPVAADPTCLPLPLGEDIPDDGRDPEGDTRKSTSRTPPPPSALSRREKQADGEILQESREAHARFAARLGIQAAEALEHAHSLGVLHRDIKPANLLIEATGHLWVADFGLARFGADSDLTRTGDLLGTLRYMSPEQVMARRVVVDHRTDIYSLGATLYEILARRPAFDGHDRQELLRRIAHEEPTPPRQLDPSIPRDLETIVLKAMAKEPEGRYATAQELADDLRRYLLDEPIQARRPRPAERIAKWSRKHRVALASAAAGLMVALAIGSALLWYQQRQTALEQERTLRAYDQNRKILDLVFSRQEKVNMEAMSLISRANNQGLGDDGAYVEMVRKFYQDMIDQAGNDPDMAELKARSYHRVGFCRMALRDINGAAQAYEQSVRMFEKLLARSSKNPTLCWLLASVLNDRGMLLRYLGRPAESEYDYRKATALRRSTTTQFSPDADALSTMAWAHLELAGHLAEDGRDAAAEAARLELIEIFRAIEPTLPRKPGDRRAYASTMVRFGSEWLEKTPHRRNAEVMFDLAQILEPGEPATLNDVAWAWAHREGSPRSDLARALQLASRAVHADPNAGDFRNTLGVVRYRIGILHDAIEAIEESMRLRSGGDAQDWYFLAMAHQRLGNPEKARRWFEKAKTWTQENAPDNEELKRFRTEAEALLGPWPGGPRPTPLP
ncbi:protein kinase domain-containing protein [Tundrisphaera lichenicola]|uniref:protein kinase domain-containing protein n=1 Tax=Tundrisphaera lichenicola TaxID=2029860 RepID=UPI003EC049C9